MRYADICLDPLTWHYQREGWPLREWRHVPQFPSVLTSRDGRWRRLRYSEAYRRWEVVAGNDAPLSVYDDARERCGIMRRQDVILCDAMDNEDGTHSPTVRTPTAREAALESARERRSQKAYARRLAKYEQFVAARKAFIAAGKPMMGRPPKRPKPPEGRPHARQSLIITSKEQSDAMQCFGHKALNLPPAWRPLEIEPIFRGRRCVGEFTLTVARAVALAWCADQVDQRVPPHLCQVRLPPDIEPYDYPAAELLSWRYAEDAWRYAPDLVQFPPPKPLRPSASKRIKRRVTHATKEELARFQQSIEITAAKLMVPTSNCLAFLPEIMRHFKSTPEYQAWYDQGFAHRTTAWARYRAECYLDPTHGHSYTAPPLDFKPGELRALMECIEQVIAEARAKEAPTMRPGQRPTDRGSILLPQFQAQIRARFAEHPTAQHARANKWVEHHSRLYAYDPESLTKLDPLPARVKRSKRTHPPQAAPGRLPPHLADPSPCEF